MFFIEILQFSPTKDSNVMGLEKTYSTRLQPYRKLQTATLKASTRDERSAAQEEEQERILKALNPEAHFVVLDETGKQFASPEFAELLRKERDFGSGKVQFLIGGSHGVHPEILKQADLVLSFSKMTFTHEMIRPFLLEQLYRACMIWAGKTYHK